jgi:hypothetical protein
VCKKWLEARHASVKTPKSWGIQIAWGRCLQTFWGTQVSKPKPKILLSLSLRSEDLATMQQLVAESEEQADAIRDPHASTTLDIIASPR